MTTRKTYPNQFKLDVVFCELGKGLLADGVRRNDVFWSFARGSIHNRLKAYASLNAWAG